MADPCAEGVVVVMDANNETGQHERLLRRRFRRPPRTLWATLSLVCRDLERRALWDVGVVHSLTQFVANPFRKRTDNKRRAKQFFQSLSKKLDQGLACGGHLLAGALSAAVCKTVVAPIERVRMDIVLSNTPYGPQRACMEILRTEGLAGFWRGNLLNIIRTAPFRAVNFYAFDVYCKFFMGASPGEEISEVERFTAGAMAGVTALLACLPLDTIRTRLLSTRSIHQYNGFAHAFREIVRTEGFSALYKGCIPGILSIAPGSAVFCGVYGTLKESYLRNERLRSGESSKSRSGMELPVLHSLLYGAIAGMCAEAVVYPLEVIRRQVQLQTSNGTMALVSGTIARNGVEKSLHSFSSACSTIVRTQGLGGFYAGCLLNTAQVLPSAALSYFSYEAFKALLMVETPRNTNNRN